MVAPDAGVAELNVTVAIPSGVTVTGAIPLFPSLVAVTVTGPPTATPVTNPVLSTIAIVPLLVDHSTTRPVSTLPLASVVSALSWIDRPWATVAGDGVTVTAATAAVDVGVELLLVPRLHAARRTLGVRILRTRALSTVNTASSSGPPRPAHAAPSARPSSASAPASAGPSS